MKGLYNTIAILFIIITLGTISVKLNYPDGSVFKYRGWLDTRIAKNKDKVFSEYPCSTYLHNALWFITQGKYDTAYEEICHALLRSGDKLNNLERVRFNEIIGKVMIDERSDI